MKIQTDSQAAELRGPDLPPELPMATCTLEAKPLGHFIAPHPTEPFAIVSRSHGLLGRSPELDQAEHWFRIIVRYGLRHEWPLDFRLYAWIPSEHAWQMISHEVDL
jgi:hypothetical protein